MKRVLTLLLVAVGMMIGAFAENVNVRCQLVQKKTVMSLGAPVSYSCTVYADSGVKQVKLTGLPKGLKYDKKNGKIVGTPNKSGEYTIMITVVTKAGNKGTQPMGVVKVPEYSSIVIGNFRGPFYFDNTLKNGLLTMKITNKGKVTGKFVSGNRKSVAIKSGWFISAESSDATFLLTFKDGTTKQLHFSADYCGGIPYGYFDDDDSYVPQDIFSCPSTKAAAKKQFGKKQVFSYDGLTVKVSPNGSTSIKGTFKGVKVNYKSFIYPRTFYYDATHGGQLFTVPLIMDGGKYGVWLNYGIWGGDMWFNY